VYTINKITSSKIIISQYYNLLKKSFPAATHISRKYLDWQYFQNPAGNVVGFNAFAGKRLVAHYAAIPVLAKVFGEEKVGLLSLNTATHPQHQGNRLFTTLAIKTYESAQTLGYDFVMGIANANSTPGFIKYLGFQLVGQLHARLGLGQITRDSNYKKMEFERLWPQDILEWRINNPSINYKTIRINKSIEIVAKTGVFGIFAILGEFDFDVDIKIKNNKKISLYHKKAPRLWLGLNDPSLDYSPYYFNIPQFLRPSPLNFIFKDLTNKNRTLNLDKVKIQGLDFDAY
jgi:hypothetical protein